MTVPRATLKPVRVSAPSHKLDTRGDKIFPTPSAYCDWMILPRIQSRLRPPIGPAGMSCDASSGRLLSKAVAQGGWSGVLPPTIFMPRTSPWNSADAAGFVARNPVADTGVPTASLLRDAGLPLRPCSCNRRSHRLPGSTRPTRNWIDRIPVYPDRTVTAGELSDKTGQFVA